MIKKENRKFRKISKVTDYAALNPMWLRSVVVDKLFIVAPIVCGGLWGFCVWSLFYYAVLSVLSSFAIILLRKRELVALL